MDAEEPSSVETSDSSEPVMLGSGVHVIVFVCERHCKSTRECTADVCSLIPMLLPAFQMS